MRRTRCIASVLLAVVAGHASISAGQSSQPRTEELRGGRWVQVDTPPATLAANATTQPASDATLTRVEELIHTGRYSEAFQLDVEWLKSNRHHVLRDRGLFLAAEARYRYGDRIKAFYYLDELMDELPESPMYSQALEKQFQIADDFLRGYKSRFLLMPIISRDDEAVEMLYRIQQRSPGSTLADKALLRTADYYYESTDYDLAADAYAAYARSYPRSPNVPQVKLKQAFANYAQFRGVRFDATPVVDARAQLTEVIAAYPQLAQQENLPEIIQRIDGHFARKLYETADFYRRTNAPMGAVYTYRFLINAYPDSPEAARAKVDVQTLPAWALESPPPGRGPVALPSTQPSASAE